MVDEVVSHILVGHTFLALTAPADADRSAVVSRLDAMLSGWSRRVVRVGRGSGDQLRLKTIAAQLLRKSEADFDPQYIEDMFAVLTEQDTAGRPAVLIVNDAECLQADAVTYLTLLSTMAAEAAPRIVLVGLPAFWQAIETAPASALKDLIEARWDLGSHRPANARGGGTPAPVLHEAAAEQPASHEIVTIPPGRDLVPAVSGETIEHHPDPGHARAPRRAAILASLTVLAFGVTVPTGWNPPDPAPPPGPAITQVADTVAAAPAADPAPAPQPEPEPPPEPVGVTNEPAAPPPPPEPAVAVAPEPPPEPSPSAPVAVPVPVPATPEVQALLSRGDVMLAMGDIVAARLLYERAASLGNGHAATMMGKTYDPKYLATIPVSGVTPDPSQAMTWYQRGAALGDTEGAERLDRSGTTGAVR